MPSTYTLISSNVLSTSAASVTFSAIPSTYTDLVLRISARGSAAAAVTGTAVTFNGSTAANYSETRVIGFNGTNIQSASNSNATDLQYQVIAGSTATSDTFGSMEIYIPSYTTSAAHPLSLTYVAENNSDTSNQLGATASLWRLATPITSFTIATVSGSFVSGSSFYLYGIKNS